MPIALTDTSKMPFGKHAGTMMQEVPASYLHYLWTNGMESDMSPVAIYIRTNLEALKSEYKNGIW